MWPQGLPISTSTTQLMNSTWTNWHFYPYQLLLLATVLSILNSYIIPTKTLQGLPPHHLWPLLYEQTLICTDLRVQCQMFCRWPQVACVKCYAISRGHITLGLLLCLKFPQNAITKTCYHLPRTVHHSRTWLKEDLRVKCDFFKTSQFFIKGGIFKLADYFGMQS